MIIYSLMPTFGSACVGGSLMANGSVMWNDCTGSAVNDNIIFFKFEE